MNGHPSATCPVCGNSVAGAGGPCAACADRLSDAARRGGLLEAIAAPVLLMQGNPRQVVTANAKALALFGKSLPEVEDHRGGQVFDCIHSFTAAGCGKDANCEDCRIRLAIVDTFETGAPHQGIATPLEVRKAGRQETYLLEVSTEKAGDLALVRIERYETDA